MSMPFKGSVNLILTAIRTSNLISIFILAVDDDLDGEPMSEELADSANASNNKGKLASMPAGFVPSRWETVDPEQVEAQAMTTSKWDLLEQPEQHEQVEGLDDFDSPGGEDSQEGDYQNYDVR